MRSLPPHVLSVMFTYQPVNDDTRSKYQVVSDAEQVFLKRLREIAAKRESFLVPAEGLVSLYTEVSEAALAYATALNDLGDFEFLNGTAMSALSAIVDARMWMNRGLRELSPNARARYAALAHTAAELAAMRMNSAIALEDPVADAYELG